MAEPLVMEFEVACPPDHSFRIWTARIDTWWPADHTVSGRADAQIILEPRLGGRIFERLPDGAEHDWGDVTIWEPPHRLGYHWHLGRDRADATDVLITFVAQGAGTRVGITHTGWERLGSEAEVWRDRNRMGWTTLLPHFTAAATREENETMAAGTKEDPWELSTAPGTSAYTMWADEAADPPTLYCQVGSTQLKYQLRAIEDLHAWLVAQGDWVDLGAADENKPAKDGTVEAFGRVDDNPVGGWYGLRKGYRGRFGMYLPPLLEALGKAELTHDPRNNKVRALR